MQRPRDPEENQTAGRSEFRGGLQLEREILEILRPLQAVRELEAVPARLSAVQFESGRRLARPVRRHIRQRHPADVPGRLVGGERVESPEDIARAGPQRITVTILS